MTCSVQPPGRMALAAILATVIAAACGDDCDRGGCDYTDGPVERAGIEAGVAGGASSASDMVMNGCAECLFAAGTIEIRSAPDPVETLEAARALFEGADPLHRIEFDGKYARALQPGEYLVCLTEREEPICAGVNVPPGGVVTFHVKYVFGPTTVDVYPAMETSPSDERVFRWNVE